MPDFLPTVSPSTGMAEQMMRMRAERPNPWVALAQSLSNSVTPYLQQLGQAKLRKSTEPHLNPDQLDAMGLSMRAPGPAQPGQPPPQQSLRAAFPNGAPMSLAENMLQRKTQEDIARETTARMTGVQQQRGEQAAAKDHVPATWEMLKNYPKIAKMGFKEGDLVPNRFLSEQSKPAGGASLGLRDQQFWEKQWVDTGKDMNIQTASSRTPLGVAVTNNNKSYRAYKLLNTKGTFTPEDKKLITTDLAAMMKGGVPDKDSEAGQRYGSLLENFKGMAQTITAKPQNLDVPEIRDHLREVMKGIVDVDNQVIRDHVDAIESKRMDVIGKRPKDWEKLKAKALKHVIEDEKAESASGSSSEFDALYQQHGFK